MQEIKMMRVVKGLSLLSALLLGSLVLWVLALWCVHKFMQWVGIW